MTDVQTPSGLDALQALAGAPVTAETLAVREPKIDAQGRAYATGKRKNAIARVWLKPGSGRITINDRDQTQYFARPVLRMMIAQPLVVTDPLTQFDVVATAEGSGLFGHPGGIRHATSRALTNFHARLPPKLKT